MRVRPHGDEGSAIVEFVFLAVVIMIPLVYLIAAVAVVQRNTLAVTQAARDAGRAFALSPDSGQAQTRVTAAVRLALADQGLPDDAAVRFVPAGRSCASAPIVPQMVPGAQFAVCVTRQVRLPAVPTILAGHGIRAVGVYVVHVDDFRSAGT